MEKNFQIKSSAFSKNDQNALKRVTGSGRGAQVIAWRFWLPFNTRFLKCLRFPQYASTKWAAVQQNRNSEKSEWSTIFKMHQMIPYIHKYRDVQRRSWSRKWHFEFFFPLCDERVSVLTLKKWKYSKFWYSLTCYTRAYICFQEPNLMSSSFLHVI